MFNIKEKIEALLPLIIKTSITLYKEDPDSYDLDYGRDQNSLISDAIIESGLYEDFYIGPNDLTIADLSNLLGFRDAPFSDYIGPCDLRYKNVDNILSDIFSYATDNIIYDYIIANKDLKKYIITEVLKSI